MTEKKFHIPTIIISAVALIGLIFTGFIAEAYIIAIISIVLCIKNKDRSRTGIGLALGIITFLLGLVYLGLYLYMYNKFGVSDMYWLFDILMKQ